MSNKAAFGILPVDLSLPKDKQPTAMASFSYCQPKSVASLVGNKYAIGSSTPGEKVYYRDDLGLFPCVYEAWKNHWNLRTTPEDWWFPVACRIAKAIDKEAKRSKKVRELFVDHEGKQNICVDIDVYTIYDVNTESFFAQMASEISGRIKVPEFAKAMQHDFSTSSATHRIASQINLMASMQQFFSYEMELCGCGIKGVEMLGEQEDWERLVIKIQQVRKELEPIRGCLLLENSWFDHVEFVFRKLAETHSSQDSKEICDFWADIFMVGDGWKYGPSGFGGHAAKEYNGWLVEFLTGYKKVLVEDFFSKTNREQMRGINSVPMTVTMKYKHPPVSEESELVAGIMGFQVHQETFNQVPSLQPHHMWAMKLPPSSPLRRSDPN